VQTMSAKGASASAMELECIRAYLAQAFPRTGGKSRK
jgi:hypothetical protein